MTEFPGRQPGVLFNKFFWSFELRGAGALNSLSFEAAIALRGTRSMSIERSAQCEPDLISYEGFIEHLNGCDGKSSTMVVIFCLAV